MSFKNFTTPREQMPLSPIYKQILEYLLRIQENYPHLYQELNKDPQFEYAIEINRKYPKYAENYLNFLKNLINQYRQTIFTPYQKVHPGFILRFGFISSK